MTDEVPGLKKEDPYKDVPRRGAKFEERGKLYYWNLSDVAEDTVVDKVNRGFRTNMGGNFGSRVHVKAVDRKTTPSGKKITKWEVLEGHGEEFRGDPNPNYGKSGDQSMPDWDTYRKMYNL